MDYYILFISGHASRRASDKFATRADRLPCVWTRVEHDQTHGLGQTHYLDIVRIKETYQGVIESCWMFASKGDLQTMSRYDMQITPRTWRGGISGN